MPNRAIAFKIIIRHLSCRPFQTSITDIHKNHVLPICPNLTYSLFYAAFRYSKFFGFIEGEKCDWHIKSVDDMCNWLCDLDDDPYIGVSRLNHPISLAFGIIIHHFNDQTIPTTKIETSIETEIENYRRERELSQYKNRNVVPHTLRFLDHFGFAEKNGSDWCIKSVGDMCAWLHALQNGIV